MVFIGAVLIFIPKINLIEISGNSAGVRIDDFIMLLFFPLLFFLKSITDRHIKKIILAMLAFVAFSVFSGFLNKIIGFDNSILYSIRNFQYIFFLPIGYYFQKYLSRFVYFYLVLNLLFLVLQKIGILGGFASEGYQSDLAFRPIGLTGGPWEIGAIANLILVYLLINKKNALISLLVTTPVILITEARSPLLAQLSIIGLYAFIQPIYYKTKIKKLLLMLTFFIFMLGLVAILNSKFHSDSRFLGLFDSNNFSVINDLYKNIDLEYKFSGFEISPENNESDASWYIRVYKWIYAIKSTIANPSSIFIGFGPGHWGIALDGGLLRLATETGIIGLILYFRFIYFLAVNRGCKFYLVAFFVNSIFIDIYMSYKFMAFMYVLIGDEIYKFEREFG